VPEIGQIVVENLPDVALVALCGEHDIATAPSVETEVDVAVAAGRVVMVDLSEASFIDSSIVGVLFREGRPRAGSSPSPHRRGSCHDGLSTWSHLQRPCRHSILATQRLPMRRAEAKSHRFPMQGKRRPGRRPSTNPTMGTSGTA